MLTPADSLIVVGGYSMNTTEELRRREDDGLILGSRPVELYQSHRKGWYMHVNMLTAEILSNLRDKGAQFFVTFYSEDLDQLPDLREHIESTYRTVETNDRWEIYSLIDNSESALVVPD